MVNGFDLWERGRGLRRGGRRGREWLVVTMRWREEGISTYFEDQGG